MTKNEIHDFLSAFWTRLDARLNFAASQIKIVIPVDAHQLVDVVFLEAQATTHKEINDYLDSIPNDPPVDLSNCFKHFAPSPRPPRDAK